MDKKRFLATLIASAMILSCTGCLNKPSKPDFPKFSTPDTAETADEPSDTDTSVSSDTSFDTTDSDTQSNTKSSNSVSSQAASSKSTSHTIIVSDESINMKVGDIKTVNANIIPTGDQVMWKSSDESVATVDESGSITALHGGNCTVTAYAKSNSGIKADISVAVEDDGSVSSTVSSKPSEVKSEPETTISENVTSEKETAPAKLESITLSLPTTVLTEGQLVTPTITASPPDAEAPQVTLKTSDSSVVYVNEDGTLWAASEGACTITVTASNNSSITDSVIVAVTKPQEAPTPEPTPEPTESNVEEEQTENENIDENIDNENETENEETGNEEPEQPTGNEDDNPRVNFYVDGILIVNKTYSIPASYNPGGLTWECSSAFEKLRAGAAADGINIYLSSGFRSYDYQASLYNGYCAYYGQASADTFSARPGHSEHQTGLAIDCNIINDSFAGTPEAIWLENHCHEYGFIIRYPYGKDYVTGYKYEPWHIRYIGDKATEIYESGLTLEEYYGLSSVYGG